MSDHKNTEEFLREVAPITSAPRTPEEMQARIVAWLRATRELQYDAEHKLTVNLAQMSATADAPKTAEAKR